MTVEELVVELSKLPKGAEVRIMYDGASRLECTYVALARGGHVVLAGPDEPIYNDRDRVAGAPTEDQDPYFNTPEKR